MTTKSLLKKFFRSTIRQIVDEAIIEADTTTRLKVTDNGRLVYSCNINQMKRHAAMSNEVYLHIELKDDLQVNKIDPRITRNGDVLSFSPHTERNVNEFGDFPSATPG